MSLRVQQGYYDLEISADEVIVRDQSGEVIDRVPLSDLDGEVTLPDGASLDLDQLAQQAEEFETSAGGEAAVVDGGSGFRSFDESSFVSVADAGAGTLGGTVLNLEDAKEATESDSPVFLEQGSFDWASHGDKGGDSDREDPVIDPPSVPPVDQAGTVQPPIHEQPGEGQSGDQSGNDVPGAGDREDPVDQNPADQNPVDQAPEEDDSRDDIPPIDGPVEELPTEETPEDPADGVPPVDTPVNEVPAEETPTEDDPDVPPSDAPVDELPTEEVPADEEPNGETPADEPANDQGGSDETGGDQAADDQAADDQIADDQTGDQTGDDQSGETPGDEPPAEEEQPADKDVGSGDSETPVTPAPQQPNAAPTDLRVGGSQVVENLAGAVVGVVSVIDPDDAQHSFQVSDSRFEVVDGNLKLKAGVALDFEREPNVAVTVTATDGAGNSYSESFALSVANANDAPAGVQLSGSSVHENVAGSVIGVLSVSDQDAGDSHTFQVSDNRFEIVDGQLSLKRGVYLDYEEAPVIDLTVTATDKSGASVEQAFSIAVIDHPEMAPQELWTSKLPNGQTSILGTGNDTIHIDTKSFSPVRLGDGYDTVHLARQDMSFDNNESVKLSGVERIDSTGFGVNKVSLSIQDVIDMTDDNNHLTVTGDKGDTVNLTGLGSNNNWQVVGSDAAFTIYAWNDGSHNAIVEISNQMTIQIG